MVLLFENNRGQRRLVSTPLSVKEMWNDISSFLLKCNFKSYYSRVNFGEDEWMIDVGSHTEFFVIQHFTEEDKKEMLKGD